MADAADTKTPLTEMVGCATYIQASLKRVERPDGETYGLKSQLAADAVEAADSALSALLYLCKGLEVADSLHHAVIVPEGKSVPLFEMVDQAADKIREALKRLRAHQASDEAAPVDVAELKMLLEWLEHTRKALASLVMTIRAPGDQTPASRH